MDRGFFNPETARYGKEWDKLEPKDKWQMFEKLTGYIVPKMTSAQIDPSQFTDEQLDELINRITKDVK